MAVFVKDPDPWLIEQHIALPCPVHPDRPAVVTEALRERLNWEVFYFSDEAARATFRKDPTHYCGLLTDPVDGTRFQPVKDSPRSEWQGRRYYFTSKENRKAFRDMPARYAERMGM